MTRYLFGCMVLALCGCGDDARTTGGTTGAGGAMDGTDVASADMGRPADAGPVEDAFVEPPPSPEPAFVELSLDPRRSIYTRDDRPQVGVMVYDRIGRLIPNATVTLDVQPEGAAAVQEDQTLRLLREGQGAVRGCVNPDLCGRVSFFVDDGPPSLTVTSPARGAVLIGDREIVVEGTTDTDGVVQVFVNDAPVAIADDGGFRHTFRAEFGLNRVEVIADDGVRRPATRVVREVVWGPEILETQEAGVTVPGAAKMRLGQNVLDGDAPQPAPGEMNVLVVNDLAGAVEVLLAQANLAAFLPNLVVEASERVRLEVVGIRIGTPQITLQYTDTGMDIFLRLDGFALDIEGELPIGEDLIDLTGSVLITAAAFASADWVVDADGGPGLLMGDVGIAIERLDGQMNSSEAQAFLDTIGGLLRLLIDRFATETVDALVREEIPEFISFGLGQLLEPLAEIELDVEGDDLLPEINLNGGVTLAGFDLSARREMVTTLDLALTVEDPAGAVHPVQGIPVEGTAREPAWPAGIGVAVALRLAAVNGLLNTLWRQGVLDMDLSAQVPEGLGVTSARLEATVSPLIAPTLPGAPDLFEFQVGELQMYVTSFGADAADQYAVSIRAGMDFAVDAEGIRFDITQDPDFRFELVQAADELPFFPAEALARLVETLVWPNLQEAIEQQTNILLDDAVLPGAYFQALAPNIQQITFHPIYPDRPVVRNGWIVLGVHPEARVHLENVPLPPEPAPPGE